MAQSDDFGELLAARLDDLRLAVLSHHRRALESLELEVAAGKKRHQEDEDLCALGGARAVPVPPAQGSKECLASGAAARGGAGAGGGGGGAAAAAVAAAAAAAGGDADAGGSSGGGSFGRGSNPRHRFWRSGLSAVSAAQAEGHQQQRGACPPAPTDAAPESNGCSPHVAKDSFAGDKEAEHAEAEHAEVEHAGVEHVEEKEEKEEIARVTTTAAETASAPVEPPRFACRDCWMRRAELKRLGPGKPRAATGGSPHQNGLAFYAGESLFYKPAGGVASRVMLHPGGHVRLLWGLASGLLLCYDFVTLPVRAAFLSQGAGVSQVAAAQILDWTSLAFWTCDIFVNLITGFERDGHVEMRPQQVAWHYLRRWFGLDASLVLLDLLSLTLELGAGFTTLTLLRMLRALRLLRLLRILRFVRQVERMTIYLADAAVLHLRMLKGVAVILVPVHLLACAWYVLGVQDGGWALQDSLEGEALLKRYAFSLQWVACLLHGSAQRPVATTPESAFVSFSAGLGYVVLSYCVTRSVAAFEITDEKSRAAMQRMCKQFLIGRSVSTELALALKKHVDGVSFKPMSVRDRVAHEEKLIGGLPGFLQKSILEEVRRPLLEPHSLFEGLLVVDDDNPVLRELCHEAVRCEAACRHHLVFTEGEVCSQVRFVEHGSLTYIRTSSLSSQPNGYRLGEDSTSVSVTRVATLTASRPAPAPKGQPIEDVAKDEGALADSAGVRARPRRLATDASLGRAQVQSGERAIISEGVLWTTWLHCGTLASDTDSTMLAMDVVQFSRVVAEHSDTHVQAMRYAACFIRWANSLDDDEAFTDLLTTPPDVIKAAVLEGTRRVNPQEHLVFISHCKSEAGTEATLLAEGFQRLVEEDPLHPANDFERPVFLDSEDLFDLDMLQPHVRDSHSLVLLLTPKLLTRPWCLLEILTALRSGVQIVPVEIQRPGLSYTYPDDRYFERLCAGELFDPGAAALLQSKGVELHHLEEIRQVFQKIAVPFSPHKSGSIRVAELAEILRRCPLREAE